MTDTTDLSLQGQMTERRLGQSATQVREAGYNQLINSCPPISQHLIDHLQRAFAAPSAGIKPDHPQLTQLLLVQYGVEKIIGYLTKVYDIQSQRARSENRA